MGTLRTFGLGLMASFGLACAAWQADAAALCGLNTQSVSPTVFYDPFNNTAQTNVSVSVPLTRFPIGSDKTQQVNFYFGKASGTPAYQIISGGNNVLYTETCQGNGCSGVGAPLLSPTGSNSGTVAVNFGAVGNPDTVNVPLTISLPAHLDLTNGLNVVFDIFYQCNGTGGSSEDQTTNVYLQQAVTMPVKVLSALEANYAGPDLDFGDVRTATAANYSTFKAPTTQNAVINVLSSGPYVVNVGSQHNFTLQWGLSTAANDTIKYTLHFLGEDVGPGGTFAIVNCQRAGLTGQQLALRATLAEGASNKTVASTYADSLVVTVTPVNIASGQQDCPSL